MTKKPMLKTAEVQLCWEIVTEGVTSARLEVHRLHQIINRILAIAELGKNRETCYEWAGDIIISLPERMKVLEGLLDRTSFALSKIGEDSLRNRLPASDRNWVEDSANSVSQLDPYEKR